MKRRADSLFTQERIAVDEAIGEAEENSQLGAEQSVGVEAR